MKLYKIENKYEIWYFTTKAKLARYLECMPQQIENTLRHKRDHIRGWSIEIIEDDHVLSKFIDPEGPIEEEQVVLMKKLDEAIKILINNDKRIKELENRIENLNELTNKLNK